MGSLSTAFLPPFGPDPNNPDVNPPPITIESDLPTFIAWSTNETKGVNLLANQIIDAQGGLARPVLIASNLSPSYTYSWVPNDDLHPDTETSLSYILTLYGVASKQNFISTSFDISFNLADATTLNTTTSLPSNGTSITGSSGIQATQPSAATETDSAQNSSSRSESTSSSAAVIVGSVLGALIFVLLVAAIGFLLWRSRNQRRQRSQSIVAKATPDDSTRHVSVTEMMSPVSPLEQIFSGQHQQELHVPRDPRELSQGLSHEMDARRIMEMAA